MSGAAKVRGQCTIEGCTKPHEARGWCKMHYTRWTRSGSTDPGPKANLPLADRFRRFFEPKPLTDGSCWIWQGACNNSGYGTIGEGDGSSRRHIYAHRLSFELHKGPIPPGMEVLHSCDNPPCVNPEHLSAGTHQRNMQEAKQRGRLPSRVGKYCKVTYQQVEEIRARAAAGERYASIARSFGLNKQYVGRLVQRTHRVSV